MATLLELRSERLRKLEELRNKGVNPYPANSHKTSDINTIVSSFEKFIDKEASIVGRIITLRKIGKIAFVVIRDESNKIQLFLKSDNIKNADYSESELNYSDINLLDAGDFIQASGKLIKTQTGEMSLEVQSLRILSKSLRPMPTSWDGFTNKEERLRRRYVDFNVNKDVHDRFIRRSKFWQYTREFLLENGFLEVNVPVLEHTTGGADANPFVTHMDALDQDFYLRISHELPLKRLIGGGYEKVFDIGPRFRNENYTEEHLPEHIAMEWYWAYADWKDGMNFMTKMYKDVAMKTFGTHKFKIRGFDVDLSKDWEILDYGEQIKKRYSVDVFNCTLDDVKKALRDNKLEVEQTDNIARGIDKLWKNLRKTIAGPAWLINTPLLISPLAKVDPTRPQTVERFQPIIAGTEFGNGWSELNDPLEQLDRFKEQQELRKDGDKEAMMLDIDFVEMLEYGMPPTCGWGYSERVFWVLEGVTAREGVPFPQLRQEDDQVTKTIYPELYGESSK